MPNKPNERVLYRLDTILESIQFIEEICKENGNIAKALENRMNGRPAISMHLALMQEQFQKLKNENELDNIKAISQYNLDGVLGIRNAVAHNYEGIDIDILIDTIKYDLPQLKAEIKSITQDFEGKTPQEKLSRMIKNYNVNKDIFYKETRLRKENAILELYSKLKNNGIEIDSIDLKSIKTIQKSHAVAHKPNPHKNHTNDDGGIEL